jgi:hypothetical protein
MPAAPTLVDSCANCCGASSRTWWCMEELSRVSELDFTYRYVEIDPYEATLCEKGVFGFRRSPCPQHQLPALQCE